MRNKAHFFSSYGRERPTEGKHTMIRKTCLLSGIAALTLMAAPAFAQDAMSPAPMAPTQTPAAAPAPAPASGTMQLSPGSEVKGSDGTVLGKLEGVRTVDGAQELTVRGMDNQLRGVPLGGIKQEGAGVVVGWSSTEYMAAPTIEGAAPAPAAAPVPASATPAPADSAGSPPAAAPTSAPGPVAPAPTPTLPEEPATTEPMGPPATPQG